MKSPKGMTIKHKLILLILGITLFTMLMSIGFIFFRDLAHFRRESLSSLQAIASVTANNTVAEVVFSDRGEAVKALSQLQYLDDFVYVSLFDKDNRFLAGFPQDEQNDSLKSFAQLDREIAKSDDFFRVIRPIMYRNDRVGSIYLKFSSQSFRKKIRGYMTDIALFAVILIVGVVVITLKAQGIVSRPILSLTEFVRRISSQRDYSLRIQKSSGDEIGLLYDGFNDMLSVIESHQGELKRYQGHLEELVEDRTRALSELNAELIRLIKAIEFSPNVVSILDHEGRIEYVNPKFEEITGFSKEEVIGQRASFLDPRFHDPESYRQMNAALSQGQDWTGEILNSRRNDSQYWEKISVSCVRDESAVITHYIVVAEDSSARKATETLLRRAKEMAEKANRLKSEFLANMSHEIRTPMNAILGYTKLLLEAENDEKKRRQLEIINISGENLLVIINDVLDFSKIEANKLELDLQYFSIADVLEHLEKMFSIKAKEKNLFMRFRIESSLPGSLYGDQNRLQQVLINIIGNAVKFTREGGVTVTVSYDREGVLHISVQDTGVGIAKEHQDLVFEPFTQADGSATREFGGTGLGLTIAVNLLRMMKGSIELVSDAGKGATFTLHIPFPEQTESSAEGHGGQNGRAMVERWLSKCGDDAELTDILRSGMRALPSIVRRLKESVEAGQIEEIRFLAHSLKGTATNQFMDEVNGLSARIYEESRRMNWDLQTLRRLVEEFQLILRAIPREYLREEDEPPGPLPEKRETIGILVAEDDSINQQLMQDYFNMLGYDADLAGNGQMVLDKIEAKPYQLLLLDMQMPVMDGMETIRRIRSDPRYKDLYVIALTGHAMTGDREKYLAAGCNDYMPKPINFKELQKKIEERIQAVRLC